VKTPLIRLIGGYVPGATRPSPRTMTGGTFSSIPPPNTQTPASSASRTIAYRNTL
jgi:hypothetical protein